MWRCGKLNPSAKGFCKEVYMRSALFGLNSKILKRAKYFKVDSLNFGKKPRHSPPYPDNIMPTLIYRKSIRKTPAYAKAYAGTKFFILKYGESVLVANFAIRL
jgi:hypothetical protein